MSSSYRRREIRRLHTGDEGDQETSHRRRRRSGGFTQETKEIRRSAQETKENIGARF
jgi:hypothetical protein